MKTLKDMTFEELVEEASRSALSELLKEGGTGLRDALWIWMNTAINWDKKNREKGAK